MTDDPDTVPSAEPEAGPTEDQDPIAAVERERDQFKAIAQRTQADFVNYKRRVDEERVLISRNASTQVLARLLPVLDDLQRAVSALPQDAPESWSDGVKLILQNLEALLDNEGVSRFEPAPGDTFDPGDHEALYHQPTDEQAAGAVLSVARPGYRTADRVLRPAQVVIARATDESRSGGPGED